MPDQGNHRQHPKPDPHGQGCCGETECETGLRNNYYVGKHLTPDALQVEQNYLVQRRRLLNRAIHGWGVAYGYAVRLEDDKLGRISIGSGLALDRVGRELVLMDEFKASLDDLIALDEKAKLLAPDWKERPSRWRDLCWLLSVHYAEKPIGQMPVKDSCGCERQEWDRVCETVRFSLQLVNCKECCTQPPECGLVCRCSEEPCCDPLPAEAQTNEKAQKDERGEKGTWPRCRNPVVRGGCRCLCEDVTRFSPDVDCKSLERIKESCGDLYVDLNNGVPLACIRLTRDECGSWKVGPEIDACGPRPLVKRNDLLFDLIRGCDLTRICEIGWKDWHRRKALVSFEDFADGLGGTDSGAAEYVTPRFWVKFSRPVRKSTLRRDCFAMTIMSVESEGGWWRPFRVPIIRVETASEDGDPTDLARKATIVVDGGWFEDAVRGRRTEFMGVETLVEIEVRGDFIIDCNGQAIDANAIGSSAGPTGNGNPGNAFLSTFRVAPAPSTPRDGRRAQGVRS